MDVALLDSKGLARAVSDLRKSSPESPWTALVEAQINIKARHYEKAKNNLETVLNRPGIEADLLFSSLKVISLVKHEMGLKVILNGVRKNLWKIIISNIGLNWHMHVLTHIGFSEDSETPNLKPLATYLISYFANQAYDHDLFDLAFFFEAEIYTNYVTRFETNESFGYGMNLTTEAAVSAGHRHGERLGSINLAFQNVKPVVGFFFHQASMLAHINCIHQYLSSAHAKGFKDFRPVLFCLGGGDSEFERRFKDIEVDVVYLDVDRDDKHIPLITQRLYYMRELCQELQVDKLIWGCLTLNMAFAFSMRFAHEQIWWSQKWQNFNVGVVDKYIWSFGMCDEQIIYGHKWLTSWFQSDAWNETADFSDVNNVRKQFSGKLILGTLSRAQKMSNPKFMKTICKILRQHENVIFIWTGRKQDAVVTEIFKAEGVLEKTQFVGWVNTETYANVLDIMLDPFPVGNGITAIQTMAAGKPVILTKNRGLDQLLGSFLSETQMQNNFTKQAQENFQAKSEKQLGYYTRAANAGEYISMANKVILDADYRSKVGEAFKRCVKDLLSSPDVAESQFTKHIMSKK